MLHFNTWLSSMGSLQCLSKRDQEGISLSHMASLSGKEKAQFFVEGASILQTPSFLHQAQEEQFKQEKPS